MHVYVCVIYTRSHHTHTGLCLPARILTPQNWELHSDGFMGAQGRMLITPASRNFFILRNA